MHYLFSRQGAPWSIVTASSYACDFSCVPETQMLWGLGAYSTAVQNVAGAPASNAGLKSKVHAFWHGSQNVGAGMATSVDGQSCSSSELFYLFSTSLPQPVNVIAHQWPRARCCNTVHNHFVADHEHTVL